MNKKLILFTALGVIFGGCIVMVVYNSVQNKSDQTSLDQQNQPSNNNQGLNQSGIISGSLTYPGERIPDTLKACAVDIDSSTEAVCTDEHIISQEYQNNTGYRLELSPGAYYVYALLEVDGQDPEKAYYNKYMTQVDSENGEWPSYNKALCSTDYQPLPVSIKAEETIQNITLGDWYYSSEC